MNELLFQPFFWGDTAATLFALALLIIGIVSGVIALKNKEVTMTFSWGLSLVFIFEATYIILIYVSLYSEVFKQWLSMIF